MILVRSIQSYCPTNFLSTDDGDDDDDATGDQPHQQKDKKIRYCPVKILSQKNVLDRDFLLLLQNFDYNNLTHLSIHLSKKNQHDDPKSGYDHSKSHSWNHLLSFFFVFSPLNDSSL